MEIQGAANFTSIGDTVNWWAPAIGYTGNGEFFKVGGALTGDMGMKIACGVRLDTGPEGEDEIGGFVELFWEQRSWVGTAAEYPALKMVNVVRFCALGKRIHMNIVRDDPRGPKTLDIELQRLRDPIRKLIDAFHVYENQPPYFMPWG